MNMDYNKNKSDLIKSKGESFEKKIVNKADYNIFVKNAKEVNQVFEILDIIDAYKANIKEVTHSKIIEYKKQMRITATRSAKEKADYLLK